MQALAFLQDLRQVCKHKSKRSSPPSPCHIRGNRARKERAYVIDVDYAGRSRWGSFLRWCSLHKSPGANKNPRLVRLQEEAQEEAERKMIGLDHTNENNNNEVSTIEIRPCEEPTTRLPVSTNSDSAVAMDGIQSSSTLSTSDTDSLRNGIIISKDSANGKQDVSQGNQSLSEIKPTTSSKHCVRSCFSILAAFVQIFLIISCIFATLWSVSSFHGVCWHTLWEWVTTSIIAIVIQAVILDTLKAVVVTVMKRHSDKRATTSLVIPHPFSQ
ncbi:uncharacterized protein LOC110988601 [Acanthaster planci]|uniref:Uncharacterized protein LOC110988601 n=1 Tax=Acanthaster planci TaxID=133434 RepID=A0A8B7ZT32_ACAPL|nr:uncharacterized protein LOC110988601 [Acanthaster planci]